MTCATPAERSARQETLYREALMAHGRELARFMAGYERDPAKREELQQELLLAIWQSLELFRGDCSLRTWVYRVAHNVGARHIAESVRLREGRHLDLESIEPPADERSDTGLLERRIDLQRILGLLHRLRPLDREVMLLYLEDLDAATIGEVTGLSAGNVAIKVHRIKALLGSWLDRRDET